jgi:hypothetical protein
MRGIRVDTPIAPTDTWERIPVWPWAVRDSMTAKRTFKYRCGPWTLRTLGQAFAILFLSLLIIVLAALFVVGAWAVLLLLVGGCVLLLVLTLILLTPPSFVFSSDSMKLGEGTYYTRALKRIEVFRVIPPPYTSGDYVIVFIFERETRPRRVPLFLTGKELKDIILGIKPVLGDVPISIKVKDATPIKLIL